VPMQVLTTNDDGPRQVPRDTGPEAGATIEAIVRDIDQDRPDLVVSYGGGPVGRALRAEFDRRKLPVVYRVVNHGYANADFFRGVAGILTCSRYLAHFYEAKFGIPFTAIHPPIDRARIRASNRTAPKYLTFVSPMMAKGVVLAAAVFAELAKSRPDIPPLVVLGRGQMGTFPARRVALTPIDHLHVMETTPDPRQFLAETKVLLMPSLDEPAGRVAAEAMLNGIPVLAARAAGLVEVVGGAGVSLDLPDTVAFGEKRAPTSKEIEPWVRAIVRLWDDAAHYEERSATASLRGELFTQETLGPAYVKFFEGVVGRPFVPRKETEPRSAVAPETKGTIKAFRF